MSGCSSFLVGKRYAVCSSRGYQGFGDGPDAAAAGAEDGAPVAGSGGGDLPCKLRLLALAIAIFLRNTWSRCLTCSMTVVLVSRVSWTGIA